MTGVNLDQLLELAVDTANEAGQLLVESRPRTGPEVVRTKTSPTDVVTAMDQAVERLIRKRIEGVRPDDAILGEEGGAAPGTSGVRWVVDPLDGTVNYVYGLPEWAVSIAVEVDGQIMAGVVNVAPRGEVFTAVRGSGAWLAGRRLPRVRAVPLARALVATGFAYEAGVRAIQAEVLRNVLPRVRDIRRGGSCAVDLCSVAAGRVDGYFERGPQYWDFAAGGLIAEEAGAAFGGLHGKPPNPKLIMAAAPPLFADLHDLVAALDPERDTS